MHDATDMDLLRQHAEGNSDAAFATLVSRNVNLVYSAALRKTGNPQAAEDNRDGWKSSSVFLSVGVLLGRQDAGLHGRWDAGRYATLRHGVEKSSHIFTFASIGTAGVWFTAVVD